MEELIAEKKLLKKSFYFNVEEDTYGNFLKIALKSKITPYKKSNNFEFSQCHCNVRNHKNHDDHEVEKFLYWNSFNEKKRFIICTDCKKNCNFIETSNLEQIYYFKVTDEYLKRVKEMDLQIEEFIKNEEKSLEKQILERNLFIKFSEFPRLVKDDLFLIKKKINSKPHSSPSCRCYEHSVKYDYEKINYHSEFLNVYYYVSEYGIDKYYICDNCLKEECWLDTFETLSLDDNKQNEHKIFY